MRTLNLGILAHVDAGKTTLTERLLYAAGVIDEIGSVDEGSTQTDTLTLERQRGITIKSAVVAFVIDDATINLIDTPGHPDFIAEVQRVLNVLDGAVLVVSAVEGVQPQTRVLMRTLQRLRIPTLIFVNKIDRAGADPERALQGISDRLTPAIIAMESTRAAGTRVADVTRYDLADQAFTARLANLLADHDERILAAYVDEGRPPYGRLSEALAAETKRARVHPVFFGSAITGAGVDQLMTAVARLLPVAERDAGGPPSGTVFKVDRDAGGAKIAYVRMFAGTVRRGDRLRVRDQERKVTAIEVFERGSAVRHRCVAAGQIGKLWGLGEVRIGDAIGTSPAISEGGHFAPPTLETVVVPRRTADKGLLHAALAQLAEQDPLINLRQDDVRQELFLSLYGEVQKEVIQETLVHDFGVEAEFRESTTICIERPIGVGTAVELMADESNPFLATVGMRIEPAPVGTGVKYRRAREVLGTMPPAFYQAVEDTVHAALAEGLHGWQVTDCTVTLTHTGYSPRQSHAHQGFDKSMSSTGADFRGLTPLVLMGALKQAGTRVFEPMHRFSLEIPQDTLGQLLSVLAQLRAIVLTQQMRGPSCVLEGAIPAARVHTLQQRLPALTGGEGVLESGFDHYRQVVGDPPSRPRTDHNPLDRKEYLLHVMRRV